MSDNNQTLSSVSVTKSDESSADLSSLHSSEPSPDSELFELFDFKEETGDGNHVKTDDYNVEFRGITKLNALHKSAPLLDMQQKVKRRQDELLFRAKPTIINVKRRGQNITEWIGEKTTQTSVSLALKGVRLITGQKFASGDERENKHADDEDDEKLDCPVDMAEIEHVPVIVPKLDIEPQINPSGKKDRVYFLKQKEARYKAVEEQAISPFTKDLASKFLKGEMKQPVQIVAAASLGPRIRVGFRCDPDKKSLTIRITEASNLPSRDSNGLSDPYCLVQIRPDADIPPLRTKIIGKSLHPQWKEVFELSSVPKIQKLTTQYIQIKVYDYDQLGTDDLLGEVNISLAQHDLIGGTDLWFDLKVPKTADEMRNRGSVFCGLRFDENQEKLILFIERCQQLEFTGVLVMQTILHINGGLIQSKATKRLQIEVPHVELKRRLMFTGIKKALMEEYAVNIYFGLQKLLRIKYLGQVTLSLKSKNKEEQEIWQEMLKMPGEVIFKLVPLTPFIGLIKKPWKAVELTEFERLGLIELTLKSSDVRDGMTFTVTVICGEDILLPENSDVFVQAVLVKNGVKDSDQKSEIFKVGERITPLDEEFDFYVPYSDVKNTDIVLLVYRQIFCRKILLGQICFSTDHTKSTIEEITMWQNSIKTTGLKVTKKLEIKRILPEITPYNLTKVPEKTVALKDYLLKFSKQKLGAVVFTANYDANAELLQVFIERFVDIPVEGTLCVEGFFWDLRSKPRCKTRTEAVHTDDPNPEFKETIKFKHLHQSFFQSLFLFVRLLKLRRFSRAQIVGQIAIKLNSPKT